MVESSLTGWLWLMKVCRDENMRKAQGAMLVLVYEKKVARW